MANQKLAWLLVGLLAVGSIALIAQNYGLNLKLQMLEHQISAQTVVTPAKIKVNQTGGTLFNFSADVASDGSVPTTVTKTLAIDITNEEVSKPVTLLISLKDPQTGENGLPKELRNAYIEVFYKVGGTKKYLFIDGKTTDGYQVTLDPASTLSGEIGVTLLQAPSGTFTKNQTYTITLYISQPNANYWTQTVTYTLKT
ncbi:MAG: hypothetical protein L3J47_10920 [Sulfurovum sp.]|nr:hypothetical protein [Sulfurovum sp.]